jgi:hypothetical protein
MGGGMAARRRVATPHRSTRQAHAQMHPTRTGPPAFGTAQGWYRRRRRRIAEVRAAATRERALEPYAADLIGEEVEGHSSRLRGRHCGRTAGPTGGAPRSAPPARYQAVLSDEADRAGDPGPRCAKDTRPLRRSRRRRWGCLEHASHSTAHVCPPNQSSRSPRPGQCGSCHWPGSAAPWRVHDTLRRKR